jgi:hypothetical protein
MQANVRLLIFSKDRALQLEGCLRSLFAQLRGDLQPEVFVLVKCSGETHRAQYAQLGSLFPDVSFVEENDFKSDVEAILSGSETMGFVVDDTLFVDTWNLREIVNLLGVSTKRIGFSLRLGRNITYCYPHECEQSQPAFDEVHKGVLVFDWTQSEYDFGYPLEVSSSIYRTGDLLPLIKQEPYSCPNEFEGMLARYAHTFSQLQPELLSYEKSVAFSCPINLVQTVNSNRHAQQIALSVDSLAESFDMGKRIDLESLRGFVPVSCHQEVELQLRPFTGE